jgi:hypothetical protein
MGKEAGSKISGVRAEQAEIARSRRRSETTKTHFARTEVALEILVNARKPLEHISESSEHKPPHEKN